MSKRPIERPKTRWEDDVLEDIKSINISDWKKVAQNRDSWKKVVEQARTLYRLQRFIRRRRSSAEVRNDWSYSSSPPIHLHVAQHHFHFLLTSKSSPACASSDCTMYFARGLLLQQSTGHSSWGNVSCVSDAVSGRDGSGSLGSVVCVILRACCFQVAELTRVVALVIKPSVPPQFNRKSMLVTSIGCIVRVL